MVHSSQWLQRRKFLRVYQDSQLTLADAATEIGIGVSTLMRVRDEVGQISNKTLDKLEAWVEAKTAKGPDSYWDSAHGHRFLKLAESGITRRALAKTVGVSRSTLDGWISKGKRPSRASRTRIEKVVRDAQDAGVLDDTNVKEVKERATPKPAPNAERVEFKEAKHRFRFFKVQNSGVHSDYVIGLVVQSQHPNAAKQDPVVIGNVRDVSGRWAARWSCPHQMTKHEVIVSGYKNREAAALALLTAKQALRLS